VTAFIGSAENEDVLSGDFITPLKDVTKDVYVVCVLGEDGSPGEAVSGVPGGLLIVDDLLEDGVGVGHWTPMTTRANYGGVVFAESRVHPGWIQGACVAKTNAKTGILRCAQDDDFAGVC
jgi:hypothetical protein